MAIIIPEIDRVTSIDIYRDGGSLSISFQGCVGEDYELFFKVILDFDNNFTSRGFCQPTLTAYYPHECKSKFTGEVRSDSIKKCYSVSWHEAIILLENMKALIINFESEYIDMFEITSLQEIEEIRSEGISSYHHMVEIARYNGECTP